MRNAKGISNGLDDLRGKNKKIKIKFDDFKSEQPRDFLLKNTFIITNTTN
jgi:hypothetical protein